ncbi:MAG: hypothetical protein JJU42_09070 [Rhodobacteraceae bacterium]|nr:hypothetical protein [Paracoccaceae bacterium]
MGKIGNHSLVAAASGFLAFVPATGMAQHLSANDIVELHSGQCITYRGPTRGTQCFEASGRATYNDRRWGRGAGQWQMLGNDMCVMWDDETEWDCGPIWRVDAATFTDGEFTWTIN